MPSHRRGPAASPEAVASGKRTLKKYPNRRLYDTQTSSYITLADVKKMVLASEDFEVRDAKTGEDLTRSILLQIILEEESGGVPIFSTQTLAQIIRLYGHAMQGVLGAFFESNMRSFTELQDRLMSQSKGLYDPKALAPEAWKPFGGSGSPVMQGLMDSYMQQSKAFFDSLQEQMQRSGSVFPGMPGFPPKKP